MTPYCAQSSLPYDIVPQRNNSVTTLFTVGTIVLVVAFLYFNQNTCKSFGRRVPMYVSSLRTKLLSARNAQVETVAASITEDVHAKSLKNPGEVKNLTQCPPGSQCEKLENVTAELKTEYDKKVIDSIKSCPQCMIMVYAPWCPHCSTALPQFAAASANTETKLPYHLINAELVSASLLMGDGAVVANVEHFPFICKRTKKENGDNEVQVLNAEPTEKAIIDLEKTNAMDYMFQ